VNCSGTEKSVFACEFESQHHCDTTEGAFVICAGCFEGAIRLGDESGASKGRLDVCLGGKWGTVCDFHSFSGKAAGVACKQLGFSRSGAVIDTPDGSYGSGPVMSNVECSGTENWLFDCSYDTPTPDDPDCFTQLVVDLNCTLGDPPVPTLLLAERISASQISISWESNSLDIGVISYTIKYYPLSQDTHMQESLEQFHTTTETEVVIRDLDPGRRYSVSVAANNAAGRGDYSDEVTVELTENSVFQLFLSGAIACVEWKMYHIDTKLQSLSASLATVLNSKCRCDFNSKHIVFNHSLCLTDHPNWFITSGLIVGTNISSSTDMMKLLQMWVEAESQVVVEGTHLTSVKDCSVYLEEGELVFCEKLPDPSVSVSSTPVQGTTTPVQEVVTYVIFAAVVFVMALVLVLVVCIVTVTVLRKKAHRGHFRPSRGKPLSASNMQAIEVGAKDIDGCEDIYDMADGSGIYETILDSSSLSDEQSITKSPAVCVDLNPYETISEPSVKTVPLHHTDFNQEPPSQCTTLQHVHTSTPGSQVDGENGLMVSLETPAYVELQEVRESGVSTTHKEGKGALKDDHGICHQNKVKENAEDSGYMQLVANNGKDENEYASLTNQP
jgi:hypothetical protein